MVRILSLAARLLRDPGVSGQVLRFGIVGGLGFVLDAAVLKGLVYLGAGPLAGRVASLAAAVTFTWVLNRSLTFATPRPASWREFAHYLANSLVGMLINYGLYSTATLLHAPLLLALAIGTIGGSVFNFFRYRGMLSDVDAGEMRAP